MNYTGARFQASCSNGTRQLSGTGEYVSNDLTTAFQGSNAGKQLWLAASTVCT